MSKFPIAVLVLAGVGFLAFGLWLTFDPVGGLALTEIASSTTVGVVELRAFYGGLELGLGAFLLACAARTDWRLPGLWLTLLGNASIGCVRLYGIWLSKQFTPFFAGALVWEFGFALAALAAIVMLRDRRVRSGATGFVP